MVNRDLEQILQNEYKRLTGGGSSTKSTGLLDVVSARAGTSLPDAPTPITSASRTTTLAAATGTPTTAAINKGYTLPVPPSPQTQTGAGSSISGEMGKTAHKLFTSGLGVMPLVSGLAGLLGGGGTPAPPAFVKYAMPRSIQITAANSRDGGPLSFADYGQDGTVRSFGQNAAGSGGQAPGTQGASNMFGGQIVVNVQAMDSRSFLDHSQEIAQAVREAMLNMHGLNDVVSEL